MKNSFIYKLWSLTKNNFFEWKEKKISKNIEFLQKMSGFPEKIFLFPVFSRFWGKLDFFLRKNIFAILMSSNNSQKKFLTSFACIFPTIKKIKIKRKKWEKKFQSIFELLKKLQNFLKKLLAGFLIARFFFLQYISWKPQKSYH